jgi:ring-1,2-phenylacetyl-CoA epoxidase subunit PaaC
MLAFTRCPMESSGSSRPSDSTQAPIGEAVPRRQEAKDVSEESFVDAVASYALRLGDDALILAQRLTWWVSRAPNFEEDVAFANIALDLLGQARWLLSYAAAVEGRGRDEDSLAYEREPSEFRNLLIVEVPNGDFGLSICRQLLFSTYQVELYSELTHSNDEVLAGIAGKAVNEAIFHRDHAAEWVVRLGDGTDLSHQRLSRALGELWPCTGEMFAGDPLIATLVDSHVTVDHNELRPRWLAYVEDVLTSATLEVPNSTRQQSGGRSGIHSDTFPDLIHELQSIRSAHPGAEW